MLNARLAESEKQLGLDLVEISNPSFLETARSKARILARANPKRETCVDEVREWYEKNMHTLGLPRPTSSNAWGPLFAGKDWEFVRFTNSKQPQGHKNLIRVWRLKGE